MNVGDVVLVKLLDDPAKHFLFSGYVGKVTKVRPLSQLAQVTFDELKEFRKQRAYWEAWFEFKQLEVLPPEEVAEFSKRLIKAPVDMSGLDFSKPNFGIKGY